MAIYFSDRELGPVPRTKEKITAGAWGGIVALIESRIADGSFGIRFPNTCPDSNVCCGTDALAFARSAKSQIPDLDWPPDTQHLELVPPSTFVVLDLIQFCYANVGQPKQINFHSFFNHHHLSFVKDEGQALFLEEINQIFFRNGLVFELNTNGTIERLPPIVLREVLSEATFQTGDQDLDHLLQTARRKFLSPDPDMRRESLEKLWDAWERLKTIEPGKDKQSQIKALLDRCSSEPKMRDSLEKEARELTSIGNSYRIRHSETDKTPISDANMVDYFFHRMFSMIRLLLRTTGKGG